MTEPMSEGESMGLVFGGAIGLALTFGGLALIVVGIYPGWAVESPIAAVILGAFGFGLGCGLLGALGYYHWHRDLVESEQAADKMPLDIDDYEEF